MSNERAKCRGTILVEDRRTERFFRELLVNLGFDIRKLFFRPAPKGKGDAGNWVRMQHPHEVNLLRRKKYQRLFLLSVRDGDNDGCIIRKTDLDSALHEVGMSPRQKDERIAVPVPTWSIETWLLALLGDDTLNETTSHKREFVKQYPEKQERRALQDAAQAWRDRVDRVPSVPSLADGNTEINRLDFS